MPVGNSRTALAFSSSAQPDGKVRARATTPSNPSPSSRRRPLQSLPTFTIDSPQSSLPTVSTTGSTQHRRLCLLFIHPRAPNLISLQSPVCRHHAYMIDVFRFDSARRSCQAPHSRSCDGAPPLPARTKSPHRNPFVERGRRDMAASSSSGSRTRHRQSAIDPQKTWPWRREERADDEVVG